jgi:hypothetical protein
MKHSECNPQDYCACNHQKLYSAEEIRKWLEEDSSEAMIALGVNVPSPPYFIDSFKEREKLIVTSIYKTLIAAKLEELK